MANTFVILVGLVSLFAVGLGVPVVRPMPPTKPLTNCKTSIRHLFIGDKK
jgi:hypothetical protein